MQFTLGQLVGEWRVGWGFGQGIGVGVGWLMPDMLGGGSRVRGAASGVAPELGATGAMAPPPPPPLSNDRLVQ